VTPQLWIDQFNAILSELGRLVITQAWQDVSWPPILAITSQAVDQTDTDSDSAAASACATPDWNSTRRQLLLRRLLSAAALPAWQNNNINNNTSSSSVVSATVVDTLLQYVRSLLPIDTRDAVNTDRTSLLSRLAHIMTPLQQQTSASTSLTTSLTTTISSATWHDCMQQIIYDRLAELNVAANEIQIDTIASLIPETRFKTTLTHATTTATATGTTTSTTTTTTTTTAFSPPITKKRSRRDDDVLDVTPTSSRTHGDADASLTQSPYKLAKTTPTSTPARASASKSKPQSQSQSKSQSKSHSQAAPLFHDDIEAKYSPATDTSSASASASASVSLSSSSPSSSPLSDRLTHEKQRQRKLSDLLDRVEQQWKNKRQR
jgi:hypothetical protein